MSERDTLMADPNESNSVHRVISETVDLPRAWLTEFLGCFMVVFVCLGSVYASSIVTFDVVTTDRLLFISLSYGLVSVVGDCCW